MRLKWLVVLILGIMLAVSLPTPAVATAKAADLNTEMYVLGIDQTVLGTNVFPLPQPQDLPPLRQEDVVRWLVRSRYVSAIILPGNPLAGIVTFHTAGNLDPNQEGNMHGTVTIDTGSPADFGGFVLTPNGPALNWPSAMDGNDLVLGQAVIHISSANLRPAGNGQWLLDIMLNGNISMQQGTGAYTAYGAEAQFQGVGMTAILSPDFHVVGFGPGSAIAITGKQR